MALIACACAATDASIECVWPRRRVTPAEAVARRRQAVKVGRTPAGRKRHRGFRAPGQQRPKGTIVATINVTEESTLERDLGTGIFDDVSIILVQEHQLLNAQAAAAASKRLTKANVFAILGEAYATGGFDVDPEAIARFLRCRDECGSC